MITLTFPSWWVFTLYFAGLGALAYVAGKLGDKTGRALGRALSRRVQRRRTQRAQRDTITGL